VELEEVKPLEEQSTIVDPKQIEADLLKEVNNTTTGLIETITKSYYMALTEFRKNQFRLKSGRSKIRLVNMLMDYPLNEEKIKSHTKDEQYLFTLANQVLECKYLLLQYSYMMYGDQMIKESEKQQAVETPQPLN
jgi:hypothetical protein